MIVFNNPSTSTTISALALTLIFLCCIISCFLNPIVFLHNRKKTSIAGSLFCILSVTDFMICLVWPIVILYNASTIHLEDMKCLGDRRQPQNCRANATSTNLAVMIPTVHLNCIAYQTTGFLAIVRFIQIKYPFYRVRKSRVLLSFVSFDVALARQF